MDQAPEQDNLETTQEPVAESPWYDNLSDPELKGNATLQRFKTAEDAHRSHLELQKTFSKDRVAWPTGDDDKAGWAEINKRLGVPESANDYKLEHVQASEGMGDFDRFKFQEQMKEANVPKAMADKLWGTYTSMVNGIAQESQAGYQKQVDDSKAALMQEWGSAYDTKISQGQAVIDTFADSKEQSEYLTATFAKDPRGIAFLAKLGAQFKEHSIGGFQDKQSFNLTPQEAQDEITAVMKSDAYKSDNIRERQPAIDRMLDLRRMIGKTA